MEMTYDEWLESASEVTAVAMGLPLGAELPERFVRDGRVFERVSLDIGCDAKGDDEQVISAYYKDERGRAWRVFP